MKKNKLRSQSGGSVVEFAIMLPFLVLLIFGMIEFGLLFYDQQVITNASREAARAAIAGACSERLSAGQIGQIVNNYCQYTDSSGNTVNRLITLNGPNNLPATNVQPASIGCGSGVNFGDDLTVTVSYNYNFLAPSILGFGATKTITAKTVMKMESNEN
jgi:Flp pilus assembly protein TadG